MLRLLSMSMTARTIAGAVVALVLAAALVACSPAAEVTPAEVTPAEVTPAAPPESGSATPSAAPAVDEEYAAAVASFPRPLPEGYSFPTDLVGAASADLWWWCSTIDAAHTAYFILGAEGRALELLAEAEANDPGSFGNAFEDGSTFHTRRIDRAVRYIDGGIDSQYLEYTAAGCWDWGRKFGHEFPTVIPGA